MPINPPMRGRCPGTILVIWMRPGAPARIPPRARLAPMLQADNRLKLTAREWTQLSTLTFEPLASLKRRLVTVPAMRDFLEGLLADCSDVPEEIELLRKIFIPLNLEKLDALTRNELLAGKAPGNPHPEKWADVVPVGEEVGADPGDE
jgi:hypothetical protein